MRRAALLLTLLVSSRPCLADCEQDLAKLLPAVPTITDADQRIRAEHHVIRARRELAEGDEWDCKVAVDKLAKLLAAK